MCCPALSWRRPLGVTELTVQLTFLLTVCYGRKRQPKTCLAAAMDESGLLDTNTFVHAHAHDAHTEECQACLVALESGKAQARLEAIVLHELSYALPHYMKQMDRRQVAEYLLMVLAWPGIRGAKDVMVDAVQRWRASERLAFVDSYLAALAAQRQCPVHTENLRDFAGQGIVVPQILPS